MTSFNPRSQALPDAKLLHLAFQRQLSSTTAPHIEMLNTFIPKTIYFLIFIIAECILTEILILKSKLIFIFMTRVDRTCASKMNFWKFVNREVGVELAFGVRSGSYVISLDALLFQCLPSLNFFRLIRSFERTNEFNFILDGV